MDNIEHTERERMEFEEFKRQKRIDEAKAVVSRIECDCLSEFIDKATLKETCKLATEREIGGIVVYPSLVKQCVALLGDDPKVSLIASISYPHGGDAPFVKASAVRQAVKDGVDEVEVSVFPPLIKEGGFGYFKKECKKLKRVAKKRPVRIVIVVPSYTKAEVVKLCQIASDCGVHMVRLMGANGETLQSIRSSVKNLCLFKTEVNSETELRSAIDYGANCVSSPCAMELATLILSQANQNS